MRKLLKGRRGPLRLRLLATVSAGVLLATGVTSRRAEAQDTLPLIPAENRLWIGIDGGFTFYEGEDTQYFGGFDPFEDDPAFDFFVGPDTGFTIGGSALYQRAGSPWIFASHLRFGQSDREDASDYGYGYYEKYTLAIDVEGWHRERHAFVDFTAGQDVGLGSLGIPNGSLVLSGGLRFAWYHAETKFGEVEYPTDFHIDRTFFGAGPQVGADMVIPLVSDPARARDQQPLTFDAGLLGTLLYGKRDVDGDCEGDAEFCYYSGFEDNLDRSEWGFVPNLQGMVAFSWNIPDSDAKLTGGYRAEAYFRVIDAGYDEEDLANRIIHGPFAAFALKLN